jgi:hypothetical protein
MANEFIVRKGLITIGGNTIINNNSEATYFQVKGQNSNVLTISVNGASIGGTVANNVKLEVAATQINEEFSVYVSNISHTGTDTYGVYSTIQSAAANSGNAFYGISASEGISNYGGYFIGEDSNSLGITPQNYGVYAIATAGNNPGGNTCSTYGGYFETSHFITGTSIGVYSKALGGTAAGPIRPSNVYAIYTDASGGVNAYGAYLDAYGGTSSNTALYTSRGNVILNAASGSGMGRTGIGVTSPTANLHIKAGTATASTAPIKLTTGSVLTTPEAGAIEYANPTFYLTNGDAVRYRVYMDVYGLNDQDNSVTNSTTLVTIGAMSVSLAANRQYEIEVMAIINASSPSGMKGALNYTGTFNFVRTYSNLFSGTSIITSLNNSTGSTLAGTEFSSTTTTVAMFLLKGHLNTSTTGTLTFQGAQAASGASGTIFRIGSYIRCRPIG